MRIVAEYWRVARRREVVRRALGYAVVVGGILIGINQADVLLAGEISRGTVAKLILTPLVPYLVSTFSSVAALRERREAS